MGPGEASRWVPVVRIHQADGGVQLHPLRRKPPLPWWTRAFLPPLSSDLCDGILGRRHPVHHESFPLPSGLRSLSLDAASSTSPALVLPCLLRLSIPLGLSAGFHPALHPPLSSSRRRPWQPDSPHSQRAAGSHKAAAPFPPAPRAEKGISAHGYEFWQPHLRQHGGRLCLGNVMPNTGENNVRGV